MNRVEKQEERDVVDSIIRVEKVAVAERVACGLEAAVRDTTDGSVSNTHDCAGVAGVAEVEGISISTSREVAV